MLGLTLPLMDFGGWGEGIEQFYFEARNSNLKLINLSCLLTTAIIGSRDENISNVPNMGFLTV